MKLQLLMLAALLVQHGPSRNTVTWLASAKEQSVISVDELLGPALSAILYQQKEAGSWVVGEVDTRNLTAGQSELASAGSTGERLTIRGGLNDEEVSGAVATLDSVVKLITQASTLGLEHVHELNEVGSGGLVTVLQRPVPKEGDVQGLLAMIMDIQAGIDALRAEPHHTKLTAAKPSPAWPTSPAHSYPLLRRAATARMLQLWLMHLLPAPAGAVWAEKGRVLITTNLLKLFQLHRAGMVGRGVVELMHVSKAAGTSMCKLAEAVNCSAKDTGPGATCIMREFDDSPRWLNLTHHWREVVHTAAAIGGVQPVAFLLYGLPRSAIKRRTCSARYYHLKKSGLDFFANEYTVYNDALLTRDPVPHVQAGLNSQQQKQKQQDDEAQAGADSSSDGSTDVRWGDNGDDSAALMVAEATETAERFAEYVMGHVKQGREGQLQAEGEGKGKGRQWGKGDGGGEAEAEGGGDSAGAPFSAAVRGVHVCRRFANVIALREPADRLRSHLRFILQTYAHSFFKAGLLRTFERMRGEGAQPIDVGPFLRHIEVTDPSAGAATAAAAEAQGTERSRRQARRSVQAEVEEGGGTTTEEGGVGDTGAGMSNDVPYAGKRWELEAEPPSLGPPLSDDEALEWWTRLAPPLMDNYLVRTLGGEGTFVLPVGGLRPWPHVALGRLVLAQYDVLLVLEDSPDSVARSTQYGLGWPLSLADLGTRHREANASLSRPSARENEKAVDAMWPTDRLLDRMTQQATGLDIQLYTYGRLLAALDDVVWRSARANGMEPYPGSGKGGRKGLRAGGGGEGLPEWAAGAPACGYVHAGSHGGEVRSAAERKKRKSSQLKKDR